MSLKNIILFLTTLVACAALAVGEKSCRDNLTPRDPNFNLSRRWDPPPAASQQLWDKAKCRGGNLLGAMKKTATEAGKYYDSPRESSQSPFGNIVHDLEKWAYKIEIEDDSSNCEMHDAHGLGPALASLGLNQEAAPDGLINCYTIWHQDSNRKDANGNKIAPRDQTYTVEGRTYRVTGAYNEMGVDHVGGAFYALDMETAWHGARKLWKQDNPDKNELPKLRRYCDLMWGAWNLHATQNNIANFRYYFSVSVLNHDSGAIIKRVLDETKSQFKEWPGVTFGMDTDAGKVLLGSPNGRPLGYMLEERKAELGQKIVTKVTVFQAADFSGMGPILLFYIEDLKKMSRQEKREWSLKGGSPAAWNAERRDSKL